MGGIPTVTISDNKPEYFGCLGYIVSWTPEYFSCLGYIASCGYPTRTHTHTRENSCMTVYSNTNLFFLELITNLRRLVNFLKYI